MRTMWTVLGLVVGIAVGGAAAAQSITSELTDPPSPLEDLESTNQFINEDAPQKSDRWNPNIVERVLPGEFGATNPGQTDAANFGEIEKGTITN
ncbi:MAG: hypothetical protein AAF526_01380 [Pseudomonadota bacterium]